MTQLIDNRRPQRGLRITLALLTAATLTACGTDLDEMQQWMEQQRREVKPNVAPLQAPKKFDPQPYVSADAVEPFSAQKLAVALKRDERATSALLAGELKRRKEPLEAYPLDSMNMVGSVNKQGLPFALLRVDGLLYQVKVGDYMGQNYGRVLRISESDLVLREVVQDAAGEWIERNSTLQLLERGAR